MTFHIAHRCQGRNSAIGRCRSDLADVLLAAISRHEYTGSLRQAIFRRLKIEPVIQPLNTEWKNFDMATGLSTNAQKSTIS